jgi:hypothetical protein
MRIKTLVATTFLLALPLSAQDAKPGSEAKAPPELTQLRQELADANAKARDAFAKLRETDAWKKAQADEDREAMDKLRADLPKVDRAGLAARALKAADAHKGDDRARFLQWAVEYGPPEAANKAVDALVEGHLNSPVMLDYVSSQPFAYGLGRLDPSKHAARLAKIRAASSVETKAWATWAESLRLAGSKDDAEKAKADAVLAEAATLAKGTDLADRIAGPQFEKDRLKIGDVAPEIEANDVNGKPMKLSDHRGKVVVLDFWGDW